MSSVLRSVSRRKKGRTLGPVEIIRREDYADLELEAKVELIRSLVPLGLMHVEELLDAEVTALAGGHYARKDASVGGRRHGSNPGTVGLAGQRVPIRVPRIRHVAGSEIPLRSYEALHGDRAVNDVLLKRVLYGISCRNYEAAAEAIPGAIGLSGSTVSRGFIQASAAKLRELQERDLSGEDVVAVVLDGKTNRRGAMVIALGITIAGGKRFRRPAGFVANGHGERASAGPTRIGAGYASCRSLVERGLDISQGVGHATDRVVFDDALLAIEQLEARVGEFDVRVAALAAQAPYRTPVGWLRCFRGIDTLTALIVVAELFDIRRFPRARGLMGFLGMIPSEDSSGDTVRHGRITKMGNRHLRRVLIEAAWHYRHRAAVGPTLRRRRAGQPARVIALADQAQQRLCRRFTVLSFHRKPAPKVAVAVARELAGFLWAVLHEGPEPAPVRGTR